MLTRAALVGIRCRPFFWPGGNHDMWRVFAAVLILAAPAAAQTVSQAALLSAADTGVDGESLSATPVTDTIDMWAGDVVARNQLALRLTVTPGTTTSITVKCYESETGAAGTWAQVSVCDGNASSTCQPDVRTYAMADYETLSAKKVIASRWAVRLRYAQCKLDDPLDGTGTVVVTGARSWQ